MDLNMLTMVRVVRSVVSGHRLPHELLSSTGEHCFLRRWVHRLDCSQQLREKKKFERKQETPQRQAIRVLSWPNLLEIFVTRLLQRVNEGPGE